MSSQQSRTVIPLEGKDTEGARQKPLAEDGESHEFLDLPPPAYEIQRPLQNFSH